MLLPILFKAFIILNFIFFVLKKNIGYLIYKSKEYKSSYNSVVNELKIIEYYA